MIQSIDRVFSDKYANHTALGDNLILLLMYRFAFPFSCILNRLQFSPNQITTISTLLAIFAAISLVCGLGPGYL